MNTFFAGLCNYLMFDCYLKSGLSVPIDIYI